MGRERVKDKTVKLKITYFRHETYSVESVWLHFYKRPGNN